MRGLPKYAFLTHTVGFTGVKVIQLERPYLIASIIEVGKNQTERMNEYLEDMAQERYPIAKVEGYTIFLKMFTSLEPNSNRDYQRAILKDMARFVLSERVMKKSGQFKGMKE